MKRKFFNVVCWIISLVFAGTLIGTGAVLYQDYKIGQESAQEKLNKLYRQTEEAISYHKYPNTEFIRDFTRAIGSADYYYSIRLETPSQQVYLFPVNKTAKHGLTVTDSRRITEGNTIDLTLTVQIYTLPMNLIFARAKVALIIILSATFLSALCLMACYLDGTSKSSIRKENDDDFDYEATPDTTDSEITETESNDYSTEETYTEENTDPVSQAETTLFETQPQVTSSSEKTIVLENTEKTTEEENDYTQASEPVQETQISQKQNISNNETAAAEVSEQKITAPEISTNREDLFSSTTGFCFEKYLPSRLDSELARAASGELDLSIMLIRIKDIDFSSQAGIDICKQLIDIFHYNDILFEYKNDGVAVIYSNADIDKAMETAETIYTEFCAILSRHNISQKPCVGIASRSLRFISGERLITEAEQALLHAKDDPDSPIIAFRVNPEKYRKFMAQNKQ